MSYEIPQQLQHKERILFGLTFGQLGWAVLWGGLSLILLLGEGSVPTRVALAFIPGTLGVLFVFFDVFSWIRHLWWFIRFRSAKIDSKKMHSLIGITQIKDGIIRAHGKDLSVVEVIPINFGIRTEEDQKGVISGFQKFLNSLDFPIQICITSDEVNLNAYFAGLQKRALDSERFEEFQSFVSQRIAQERMRNRRFFIVIPKHTELSIQTSVVIDRLKGLGLQPKQLEDKEILPVLSKFFRKTPIETNAFNAMQQLLAPNTVRDRIDNLEVDGRFTRIVTAVGYPRSVESGFLDKLISSGEDYDISMHIEPFSIETMMILLNKELQKQRADLYAEKARNSINPSLEIKYEDTRKVLEALQKGKEKLFNVSLYISCKAENQQALNLLAKKIESELHSLMIVPSTPLFRQVQAYQSSTPLAYNAAQVKRNITTSALSAFFPFTAPFLTVDDEGVMLGLNKNHVPYIKDVFGLSNANGVVLATSGAGKSYFTKLLIARQRLTGTKVIIIDPQNEYSGLVQKEKGQIITISRLSKTCINPLDLMGHDFIEKRLSLMDAFKIMFGELTEIQKSILDKALAEAYARKGIDASSFKHKKPPVLQDVYDVLVQMDKQASSQEKLTYRALINRLYLYTKGVFGFLNKQSNIDFNKDLVCFNIGDMPKQVKPLIMFLILDYVYMNMKQNRSKKLLVVDEAWSLLGHTEEASYIFEIVKTARKYNLGLLLITQDVADLLNSQAGGAVLANSAYTFLLRQKSAIIERVAKTFHLSQAEREYLLTATQGKGILILDNEHQELEVIASPEEHNIVTTNPNEKSSAEETEDDRTEISIQLDVDKGLYYARNLSLEEKNYLANHGYAPGQFVPIGKPRQEECWVKANKVESLGHTFLVQNIREHFLTNNIPCQINITEGADIEVKTKSGIIAIEVETGLQYKRSKTKLARKFSEISQRYIQTYIVLTDKDYKGRYETLLKQKTYLRTEISILIKDIKRNHTLARSKRSVGRDSAKFSHRRPDTGRTGKGE